MQVNKAAPHFQCVDEVLAVFEAAVEADELRKFFHLDGIEYLWTSERTLIPSITASFASPYLYRGQVERFPICIPSVFRGLKQVSDPQKLSRLERAKCFAHRVKLEEFVLALDAHPASDYAREIGLRMHPYALAQHYEIATDKLDLTQDHKVAAFFATNAFKDGRWSPMIEGSGVLYRLHNRLFAHHMPHQLECIGKQALPRPGEQKAYTLTLPIGCDLESLPVEIYTFAHDKACGQRLNNEFAGGASLFPPDVMSEIADTIKSASSMPEEIVCKLLGVNTLPSAIFARVFEENKRLLEDYLDVTITSRNFTMMNASQNSRALGAVQQLRSTFLKGVGVLPVRDAGLKDPGR